MTDLYNDLWSWDRSIWSSHCGNCIANCAYRMYIKDGEPLWEEQSGDIPGYPGVPDMNPLGCQKGQAWLASRDSGERILSPLRRVGERGSGQWEEVSWDEALGDVADAIIDAIQDHGSQSVVLDEGAEGGMLTGMAKGRFIGGIDGTGIDSNSTVSDVHLGHWATFGSLVGGSSADDTFRSELILIWNANPSFTRIPYYHYITEARYNGAHVVTIAPDYSPSCIPADQFVPITPGMDAAFGLAMCKTILDEGLANFDFVKTHTDLPLLVRTDNKRLLRESDMVDGGKHDNFYVLAAGAAALLNKAVLGDPANPELHADGFEVELADGSKVAVRTVFEYVEELLEGFTAESAAVTTGVSADVIKGLARMAATKRTKLYNGLGSCKHYHGDLMERAMDLMLALTGNWGSAGRGWDTYIIAMLEGEALALLKRGAGAVSGEMAITTFDAVIDAVKSAYPGMTDGGAVLHMMRQGAAAQSTVPPAFYLWYHCGFDEMWDVPGWGDNPRPMKEYIEESISNGWWGGLVRPDPDVAPQVLIQAGTNTLRRTRGGQRQMLKTLWPKLKMIVAVDWKMGTVGLNADIVLPVAHESEVINMHAANSHSWERMFSDQATEPKGDTKSDWQIFQALSKAIGDRAAARGLDEFKDSRGGTRKYSELWDNFTLNGAIADDEKALDDVLRDCALAGNLESNASVSQMRQKGWVRPLKLARAMSSVAAGEISEDEPFIGYRWHVEDNLPYPTLTSRAQFYIDHPWFLEAGEELPTHKPPPKSGGDYPLQLTGGHPRWSIHATNTTNPLMLHTTRGKPVVHINSEDAKARGIKDDDMVRLFNDAGEMRVCAKVTPAAQPGQVILYASWEPYVFENWKDTTWVEPGMVKWLHFAAGYGHLGYSNLQWQPEQSDRLFRLEAELAT
ncbi:MAG: hypothetical protein DCC49_11305 [Acidobacteria bacterium]|nr:MAG: hypothetical protein DCC49_11305 [Acidobacteriota bacterium]